MNLKLLLIICEEEKKIKRVLNEFHLPFNVLLHGEGTASQGILDFLGLSKTEKNILLSIIPDVLEKDIIDYLRNETNIKELGKGVAFVVPLSSSSKYVLDDVGNKNATKASELKVTNPTLIKIEDKEITEYIEGKDNILEYLK